MHIQRKFHFRRYLCCSPHNKSHSHFVFSSHFVGKFLLVAILVGFCSLPWEEAKAAEGVFSNIHNQYQSPRAAGMGGAFVAVANDYSTLFYNPAGLARLQEGQINLSMDFIFAHSFKEFYDSMKTAGDIKDPDEQYAKFTEILQQNYGKNYTIRAGLFEGIWVRPNWGVAVLPAQLSGDLIFHNQGPPALDIREYFDTTVAYGLGYDYNGWIPGRFSWGFTGKFIERNFVTKEANALDLVVDPDIVHPEDYREGYTVDFDLGFLYTPEFPTDGLWYFFQLAKPTFGLVGRNLLDYGFGQNMGLYNKKTTLPPEKLFRVFDVGMKWEYPSFWIFGGRGVLDIRDIGHPNFNLRKGSHIGFEFDWTMASWWKGQYRVGLNQGYLSLGASALFSIFRLDLASYSEDIGSYNNPKENRLYEMKLNIDL